MILHTKFTGRRQNDFSIHAYPLPLRLHGAAPPGRAAAAGARHGAALPRQAVGGRLGLYPIITFQYGSTTLYQVSYHMQYLFF